jgi:hypothetical protein
MVNSDGSYSIPNVVGGSVTVTANGPGYKTQSKVVSLSHNGNATANFTLEPQ